MSDRTTLGTVAEPAREDELRQAKEQLASGRFEEGMELLFAEFAARRRRVDNTQWDTYCASVRDDGSLMQMLLESPLTRRAYTKPRGYAGDAVLMDLIYGRAGAHDGPLSKVGRAILHCEYNAQGSRSVRSRCELIAQEIDRAAECVHRPDVLAVACGHLREADLSTAIQTGRFGTFIALDNDVESLREVDRCYKGLGVTPRIGSVRDLLTRRKEMGSFDLVYATGLYDYLNQKTARALTSVLLTTIRPGGKLVVGNFAPDMHDIGYMEAVLDWRLVYRNEAQMADLMPNGGTGNTTISREVHGNIVFLHAKKDLHERGVPTFPARHDMRPLS